MPRLRHYDNLETARFITFCCYHRYKLLVDDTIIRIVIDCLKATLEKYNIKIFGYVIMPEHLHLVLQPPSNIKLGIVIGYFKSISAYKALAQMRENKDVRLSKLKVKLEGKTRTVFWQRRCYDHNCRTLETTLEKINYCHKNPVVRELVNSMDEWKWSSYNWYMGKSDVPLFMDSIDSIEIKEIAKERETHR
jgi:REP-associated tyrosine transposase